MSDLPNHLSLITHHTPLVTQISDSVTVCDNIRISRCKIVQGEEFRGYISSKKRYFYGVRAHVLATVDGIPVEIVFLPGRLHDVNVLKEMPFNLPPSSEIFSDSAFILKFSFFS
jgi:hypothetical protein